MRIALIAPPWVAVPPPAYGGTETVLDELARGLTRAGHEVLLHTTGDSTCPVARTWVVETAPGTAQRDPVIEVQHVLRGYQAAHDWGAEIVHDHTVCGPLIGLQAGIPIVTTNHGPFEGALLDIYREMAPRVPVIAISEHQARTAGDIPVAQVIHHGIDVEQRPFGDGQGGYALFLGRMCPDKGVDVAIRVARAAGTPLVVAAKMKEPMERAYFEEKIAPLLGPDVRYLGEVGGAEKLELLGRARCLLNPLRWPEPFGMVMIEALACGTPVVATPHGSVPEIVEDATTGFVAATEEQLVAALARVGDVDRRVCREAARTRFSTTRMVEDHLQLYGRVLAGDCSLAAA